MGPLVKQPSWSCSCPECGSAQGLWITTLTRFETKWDIRKEGLPSGRLSPDKRKMLRLMHAGGGNSTNPF